MPRIIIRETREEILQKELFSKNWTYGVRASQYNVKWQGSRRSRSYSITASLRNWSAICNRCYDLPNDEFSSLVQVSYDSRLSDVRSSEPTAIPSPKDRLEASYRINRFLLRNRNQSISKFTNKLSNALATEPDLSRRALEEFEQYACRIIAARGIELTKVDTREWVSTEDQTWRQLIIDFKVKANPEIALALWDNLSAELRTFLNARWREESVQLGELLSVSVQW